MRFVLHIDTTEPLKPGLSVDFWIDMLIHCNMKSPSPLSRLAMVLTYVC